MYYRFFERGLVGSYETDGTIALEEYYNESPETWTPEEVQKDLFRIGATANGIYFVIE